MAKFYDFSKEYRLRRGEQVEALTIFDVAKAFLYISSMTHKKLQKLCYYAQAWHLALYDENLFNNRFEAWVHGPVCSELYQKYKPFGWANIPKLTNLPLSIDEDTFEFVINVFDVYGECTGDDLESLTHQEEPWKIAREGLREWEPSYNVIKEDTMKYYYRKVYEESQND